MKNKSGRTTRLADKYIQQILSCPNHPVTITDHSNTTKGHLDLIRLIVNRVWAEHKISLYSDPIRRQITYKTTGQSQNQFVELWVAFKDMVRAMGKWTVRRMTFNNIVKILALFTLIKILLVM